MVVIPKMEMSDDMMLLGEAQPLPLGSGLTFKDTQPAFRVLVAGKEGQKYVARIVKLIAPAFQLEYMARSWPMTTVNNVVAVLPEELYVDGPLYSFELDESAQAVLFDLPSAQA